MTPVTVATIRLFGDHPVLDFTNTVHPAVPISVRMC